MEFVNVTDLLPAHLYNLIKHVDSQVCSFPDTILSQLGQILVNHGMNHHFNLEILHRHIMLPPNSVMLHSISEDGTDMCHVQFPGSKGPSDLFPHSFFLGADGRFQPFEYDETPSRMALSDDFLRQLRSFLQDNKLENRVAISRASEIKGMQVEYLLPSYQGTRCVLVDPPDSQPKDTFVTTWQFNRADGCITWNAQRWCKREAGRHVKKPDESSGGARSDYT